MPFGFEITAFTVLISLGITPNVGVSFPDFRENNKDFKMYRKNVVGAGGDVAGNCGRGRGDVVRPGGIVIRPEKNVVGPGIDPGTFRFSGGRSTD